MTEREHELSTIPRRARAFQGERAGVVTRTLAATIDGAIAGFALLGLYVGYSAFLFLVDPRGFSFPDPSFLRSIVLGGFILGAYTTVCWGVSGRTYGNVVLGLRVVSAGHHRLGWFRALLRSAFYVLLPIGLMWVAIDRRLRSVQDLVLHTTVVYDWKPRSPGYRPEP